MKEGYVDYVDITQPINKEKKLEIVREKTEMAKTWRILQFDGVNYV